jgi:hypothetical protein
MANIKSGSRTPSVLWTPPPNTTTNTWVANMKSGSRIWGSQERVGCNDSYLEWSTIFWYADSSVTGIIAI